MKIIFLFLLLALALSAFIYPGKKTTGEAKIVIDRQENILQIKGFFQHSGAKKEQFSYKLYTVRVGKSGISQNAQGGRFEVAAGEKEMLAQTHINVNPGDDYEVKLQVFRNGELVSEDSVLYEGEKIPVFEDPEPEEEEKVEDTSE